MFLDGETGKEFALIKGHKGFVRRAMAHGVSLVPVYGEKANVICGHCESIPSRGSLEGRQEYGALPPFPSALAAAYFYDDSRSRAR